MNSYSKLIAALVGMAVLALKQFFDIDLGDGAGGKITDLVVMVLTAVGVWKVENK
jgi:hypothetical protein